MNPRNTILVRMIQLGFRSLADMWRMLCGVNYNHNRSLDIQVPIWGLKHVIQASLNLIFSSFLYHSSIYSEDCKKIDTSRARVFEDFIFLRYHARTMQEPSYILGKSRSNIFMV